MYSQIKDFLDTLKGDFGSLLEIRSQKLDMLSQIISDETEGGGKVDLVFVCTHNSRRSHLAQIWSAACIDYTGLEGVQTYSAGTEATALNANVVETLTETGFKVSKQDKETNPMYQIRYSDSNDPIVCYSKTIDDKSLPSEHFIAVMTCSDAEQNCPVIPGALHRIPITYADPKLSDGSGKESSVYGERSRQIATEMLYVMSKVRSKS